MMVVHFFVTRWRSRSSASDATHLSNRPSVRRTRNKFGGFSGRDRPNVGSSFSVFEGTSVGTIAGRTWFEPRPWSRRSSGRYRTYGSVARRPPSKSKVRCSRPAEKIKIPPGEYLITLIYAFKIVHFTCVHSLYSSYSYLGKADLKSSRHWQGGRSGSGNQTGTVHFLNQDFA